MGFVYTVAAFMVVPGILMLFHWLSRTPKSPSAPSPSASPPPHPSIADEAERWLRSRR